MLHDTRRVALAETANTMSSTRVDQVVASVSMFARALLELRCPVAPSSHTVVYDEDDPHRLKTVAELIVSDGNSTFGGSVGEGVECSARDRRRLAHARAILEYNIEAMRTHCGDYLEMLYIMDDTIVRRFSADAVVDLHTVVTADPRWALGYFCKLGLDAAGRLVDHTDSAPTGCHSRHSGRNDQSAVGVGGLAAAVASTVEDDVKRWVVECESAIERDIVLNDDDESVFALVDTMRTSTLRKELTLVITNHVAMIGLLRGDDDDPARLRERQPALNDVTLRRLLASQLDDDAVARCERCREDQIDRLLLLDRLCSLEPNVTITALLERGEDVLRALRDPPRALYNLSGFASLDMRANQLAATMPLAMQGMALMVAAHIDLWRVAVGASTRQQYSMLVGRAIESLRGWKLPKTGFLPTLHAATPPLPRWSDQKQAAAALERVRPMLRRAAAPPLPLPRAIERSLRLVSMIYEMLAWPELASACLKGGCIATRYVQAALGSQVLLAEHANTILAEWAQRVSLGENLRRATDQISTFRGSQYEDAVRAAACHLAGVSFQEFLAVASEDHSPVLFHAQKWRIVDAVAHGMGRVRFSSMSGCISNCVGLALDLAVPLFVDLRQELGLGPRSRPSQLALALQTVPKIRWVADQPGQQLVQSGQRRDDEVVVLTHDDLRVGVPSVVEALRQLSTDHASGVRFGRLRSKRDAALHGTGQRRVFSLPLSTLRALLLGDNCS